jgi:hypothetical protein
MDKGLIIMDEKKNGSYGQHLPVDCSARKFDEKKKPEKLTTPRGDYLEKEVVCLLEKLLKTSQKYFFKLFFVSSRKRFLKKKK